MFVSLMYGIYIVVVVVSFWGGGGGGGWSFIRHST